MPMRPMGFRILTSVCCIWIICSPSCILEVVGLQLPHQTIHGRSLRLLGGQDAPMRSILDRQVEVLNLVTERKLQEMKKHELLSQGARKTRADVKSITSGIANLNALINAKNAVIETLQKEERAAQLRQELKLQSGDVSNFIPDNGCDDGPDNIPSKLNPDSLMAFNRVANKLIRVGYYAPLVDAVIACSKLTIKGVFMVMDCPSGTGKTLSGVALRLIGKASNFEGNSPKLQVAHVVWDSARETQQVYQGIHAEQEENNFAVSKFREKAERAMLSLPRDFTLAANFGAMRDHMWKHALQYIFSNHHQTTDDWDYEKFLLASGLVGAIFVLFWDEMPTSAEDVLRMGKIRDLLKHFIVVILAGTNSKAANMIGLSTRASSSGNPASPWSMLFTRLPKFVLECANEHQLWITLKANKTPHVQSICSVIEADMRQSGIPRLIIFAIRALAEELQPSCSIFTWQRRLAQRNVENKFFHRSWGEGFEIIVSQGNLLLGAAADSTMSDALIRKHYARRAAPDDGKSFASDLTSQLKDCACYLYIAPGPLRGLGTQLLSAPDIPMGLGSVDWQVTIFPSPERNILLYLASCWENGFFSLRHADNVSSETIYTAFEVLSLLWTSNSFGFFNFQNVLAPVNTGSFQEVLTLLAAFNAAAMQKDDKILLSTYIIAFIQQLGISLTGDSQGDISKDEALDGLRVNRLLFPGKKVSFMPDDSYGTLHRPANIQQVDLVLDGVMGKNKLGFEISTIFLEDKFRISFSVGNLVEVCGKLVVKAGDIGILVLRSSTDWYGDSPQALKNLVEVDNRLKGSFVGTIHFVDHQGQVKVHKISKEPGRLFVIRIPPLPKKFNANGRAAS